MLPRTSPLPPILPILDAALAAASLEEFVGVLGAAGARWIEYRDKRASDARFLTRVTGVAAACERHGIDLLVNDRVEMAVLVSASGVHLGADDLPPAAARRLLGADAIVGLSVDTVQEAVDRARQDVDYLAIGPIFATATKLDAGAAVGLETVVAARARVDLPLVAIGGITPENAAAVTAAGADCVAAVSSILGASDPGRATERLRAAALEGLDRR